MPGFATCSTQALVPEVAASQLADAVEAQLGGAERVGGGFLLATAAAGDEAVQVARQLVERWPGADLVGTSFEGILSEGRLWRDEPALALLAWAEGPEVPLPFVFEEGAVEAESLADAVLDLTGQERLRADDLLLLFPDALGAQGIEALTRALPALLGLGSLAGAAASGVASGPAQAWQADEARPGGLAGLLVLGGSVPRPSRVRSAGASRVASPWLEITSCRSCWIDGLDGEPPLDWVRRQLGLDHRAPLEPHLDQLLVRIRRSRRVGEPASESDYDERFLVGLDDRRGAFMVPGRFGTGDHLALALPDAALARDALRSSIDALPGSPLLLQFTCRARDAALHGDAELESAIVAHHVADRCILGTVSPYQLGPGAGGQSGSRMLVYATVLAALGSVRST